MQFIVIEDFTGCDRRISIAASAIGAA